MTRPSSVAGWAISGPESIDDVRNAQAQVMSGIMPTQTMGGWFEPD